MAEEYVTVDLLENSHVGVFQSVILLGRIQGVDNDIALSLGVSYTAVL